MTRSVAVLMLDGYQPLDALGPYEVFAAANAALAAGAARGTGYAPLLVGATRAPVVSESGVTTLPHAGLASLVQSGRAVHTLLVAGGAGPRRDVPAPRTLAAIRALAARATRVGSVCTGAFVLGHAGLIAKKRVTTHWAYCAALSLAFPEARVEPEPIYVRDGKLWTSAGVTAGIDLALAMVEADLGRALSLLLARHLVMFVRRAGGQAQFSPRLVAQLDDASPLAAVLRYVGEHPERDLSVPVLAKLAGMSVRHFSRTFAREAGVPPARYVERVRIDEARRLLEDSRCSVEEVATRVGFTSADALRHALKSALSLSPRDYRARFGTQREE